MQQIPLSLLNSSIEVRTPLIDENGYNAFSEPFLIEHVRFEPRSAIRQTSYSLQDTTTGVLFIDAVNSIGVKEIPAGSLIKIDGADVESAVKVSRRFDGIFGKTHHWEIEVS